MSWCSGWFCFMQPATATVLTFLYPTKPRRMEKFDFFIASTIIGRSSEPLLLELVDDRAQTTKGAKSSSN